MRHLALPKPWQHGALFCGVGCFANLQTGLPMLCHHGSPPGLSRGGGSRLSRGPPRLSRPPPPQIVTGRGPQTGLGAAFRDNLEGPVTIWGGGAGGGADCHEGPPNCHSPPPPQIVTEAFLRLSRKLVWTASRDNLGGSCVTKYFSTPLLLSHNNLGAPRDNLGGPA